jgi:hypothetical protein
MNGVPRTSADFRPARHRYNAGNTISTDGVCVCVCRLYTRPREARGTELGVPAEVLEEDEDGNEHTRSGNEHTRSVPEPVDVPTLPFCPVQGHSGHSHSSSALQVGRPSTMAATRCCMVATAPWPPVSPRTLRGIGQGFWDSDASPRRASAGRDFGRIPQGAQGSEWARNPGGFGSGPGY